ncbi:hypothetical protein [Gordonia neofelifaecis]|uniref:Uncharacterized protein n=1 Tax=Gordonia neofelifaecis NRRL B-59395 TaxID=644548 RepID=F1YIE0_9ACTN|nr:hypothetical protein [Gordonia neofelifaecis]EGD55694.1 hypothetical protein SCNU_08273 [Gordonia neofelifaecis NRRL B-59395]
MTGIEIQGANGESIVYDGATVAKFKHAGKQETARNPVSTYREVRIKEKTSLFGKPRSPREYDVLLAMSSIMSLTVDDAGRVAVEELVARLERR